jgi:hypothetical protein
MEVEGRGDGLVCSKPRTLESGSLYPTAVRSDAESLGLSHEGDGLIFLKTSAPHSLMTTNQMKLPDTSRWTVPLTDF